MAFCTLQVLKISIGGCFLITKHTLLYFTIFLAHQTYSIFSAREPDMEADNENHQTNVVESGNDACGHECVHGNSHGSSSDGENSVNDDDYDFEQRNASRFLGLLTCTNDVLPLDGMFMHTLRIRDPVFERVSFDSIKDDCLIHYEKMIETAEQVLRNFDGQISLSVDILRCRKAYEYMCLKAHFITEDWNLGNWVLNFRRINATWEDDCLDGAILKVLRGWDIGNKIASITFLTDWVYDEGIDNVKEYVQEMKKLQFNGQIFRLYCSADIFKSMVQDAFKVISGTICKIDELMYFGKPSYLWDLAYDRLKMALECEAKEEFGKEGYDSCDKPSADEWKKVEGICKLLESLYNAAKALFETKDATANIYLQNLREVQATLTKEANSSDSFIRDVAAKMHERFDEYWKNMFLVLAIATVMDPRCKITYFEFSSTKYGGNDDNTEVSTVVLAIRSLYDIYNIQFPETENRVSNPTSADSGVPMSVVTSMDAFFTIEREISPRYASLKPDLMNAIMCTRSWFPDELKSIVGSSLGFEEMLEEMDFVEDLYLSLRH
nr:zinc finger bed domain-containing protein ricesleeper 1 [Quercus suber]